jgi:hypothetical protein
MELEDIKVGKKYEMDAMIVEVLCIGNEAIFLRDKTFNESSFYISHFLSDAKEIIPKRETIELFPYLDTRSQVCYLDHDFYQYDSTNTAKYLNTLVKRKIIPNLPSIFIDAKTYEPVEVPNE